MLDAIRVTHTHACLFLAGFVVSKRFLKVASKAIADTRNAEAGSSAEGNVRSSFLSSDAPRKTPLEIDITAVVPSLLRLVVAEHRP